MKLKEVKRILGKFLESRKSAIEKTEYASGKFMLEFDGQKIGFLISPFVGRVYDVSDKVSLYRYGKVWDTASFWKKSIWRWEWIHSCDLNLSKLFSQEDLMKFKRKVETAYRKQMQEDEMWRFAVWLEHCRVGKNDNI